MISEFQAANGLKVDGIIGKYTSKVIQDYLGLTSNAQAAHFLGQCHHESGAFKRTVENLNYSEKRLLQIFPKYFTNDISREPHKKLASAYANKPYAIGSRVYANRMGNGDEASGDGYKHRGQGLLQLTGKNNQQRFAESINNLCIMDNPDIIGKEFPLESAVFFFDENDLWDLCNDVNDDCIIKLTKRINGGTNGLEDRINQTKKYFNWLNS